MWFNRVPEPKTAKNRLHFDLRASGMLADEVRRLTNLGSSWLVKMKTSWSCRIPTEASSVSSSRSDGRSPTGQAAGSPPKPSDQVEQRLHDQFRLAENRQVVTTQFDDEPAERSRLVGRVLVGAAQAQLPAGPVGPARRRWEPLLEHGH